MIWSFEPLTEWAVEPVALTRREKEIANFIVDGQTSKEIAQTLRISRRTVEAHRAGLMRKLAARNTAELVARIISSP